MTHSHDTATPALSVESEYVLVPREFLHFLRGAPVSSGVCCCGDEMDRHSDPMSCGHSPVDMWDHGLDQWLKQIAAAPAPNPSPAAKGGEAGAVPTLLSCPFCGGAPTLHPHSPDRMLGAWVSCSTCGLESPTETGRSVEAAVQHWNTREALATPSPQPANAVREALIEALGSELSGAYDCTRVWEAWSVGTMDQDDFVPVSDRLDEIVESVLAAIQPTTPLTDDRIIEIAVTHSNCKLDRWKEVFTHDQIISFAHDVIARAALTEPAPAGEAVEPAWLELGPLLALANELSWSAKTRDISDRIRAAISSLKPAPEDIARLREDLERVTRENATLREERHRADNALVDRYRDPKTGSFQFPTDVATIVRRLDATERERDDAVKALETAREDLGLFRDFVINNATVWVSGSNHHHPMWERIARHLEAYQSPTNGDLWKLVCSAYSAARSASREGASDE